MFGDGDGANVIPDSRMATGSGGIFPRRERERETNPLRDVPVAILNGMDIYPSQLLAGRNGVFRKKSEWSPLIRGYGQRWIMEETVD